MEVVGFIVAVCCFADERDGLVKASSSNCMNGGHSTDSGREPEAACGSGPQLSGEPGEGAASPEASRGAAAARRSSDTGTGAEPKGARQTGGVRRSMSEKGPSAHCGR